MITSAQVRARRIGGDKCDWGSFYRFVEHNIRLDGWVGDQHLRIPAPLTCISRAHRPPLRGVLLSYRPFCIPSNSFSSRRYLGLVYCFLYRRRGGGGGTHEVGCALWKCQRNQVNGGTFSSPWFAYSFMWYLYFVNPEVDSTTWSKPGIVKNRGQKLTIG